VLSVLIYLHRRAPPVIHRDVTPKNVILRPTGCAALVDFGSVQAALGGPDTLSSTAAGTFGYAPHEQFVGRASPASDLYGLGMTFLAVATGREPGEMDCTGLRVEVGHMLSADPRLVHLLASMIEPDPRFRLRSAHEALARLALLMKERLPLQLARAADQTAAPAPGCPISADAYLDGLQLHLAAEGFAVERGGDAGRTPLAFSASRSSVVRGEALWLGAARAEAIEGATPGRALDAVASGLFVHAAALANAGAPSFLRSLLGARRIVAPIVVSAAGVQPHTIARVAAGLREPDGISVVPVFIDLAAATVETITPPSMEGQDVLLQSLRSLLALPGITVDS
jgi:hypothetical protein